MSNKKSKYEYLKKKPRIPGVNSIYNIGFVEKQIGKKDAKTNQICQMEEGHITPYIDNKVRLYDSYIDKIYLRTSMNLDFLVQEANALVVEINIMLGEKPLDLKDNGEQAQRLMAMESANRTKMESRKRIILTRLAEIHGESDMVDESLKHHIERAEGILHSHLSKYWRGILISSAEKLNHFPYLEKKEYPGRNAYLENREKLIDMIKGALRDGGGVNEQN